VILGQVLVRRPASSALHNVESVGEKSTAWRKAIMFEIVEAGTATLAQQMGSNSVRMGEVILLLKDKSRVHTSLVIGELGR
jgi:hypothetical protein